MEFKHRFACYAGRTTLYKFRPFSDAKHKGWVREILENHTIYFSRPSQLNDPFDMAPLVRLDRSAPEPEVRTRLMQRAKEVWTRSEPNLGQAELNARLAWFS